MEYRADLRDIRFNLLEWLELEGLLQSPAFADFGRDDFDTILSEALKVCKGAMAACNEEGDSVGALWEDGSVRMPPAFHRAYKDLAEGGWCGATASPDFGGMGLPECVGTGIHEFITGSNTALSLTLLLGRGTANLIESFGPDWMKALYCSRMFSGEWAGTMCLTEPSAGSDLGDISTRATRVGDGRYMIKGEKIFITSGEHDLTPNIVHAVLARTPEAPVGAKGLSLFVVPKFRVNPDGSLGQPNDVFCAKIEHKMGIHGSPTCNLLFGQSDGCEGFLLGRERLGLLLMFQMMNMARYEVGMQGLAIASAAHQAALAYSRERLQGRHYSNKDPHTPQVPIVGHPDVRRMLLFQSSAVQAMRAMLSFTAYCLDMAKASDGSQKDHFQGMVEILTPICKAWCSDLGFQVADSAMQCFGGFGYIRDYPAEQYLRDARIASIYEGTNGIQALDLVGRKFRMKNGDYLKAFLRAIGQTAARLGEHPVLGPSAALLGRTLLSVSDGLAAAAGRSDAAVLNLLNAVHILDALGTLFGAHLLLDQAAAAEAKLRSLAMEKSVEVGGSEAYRAFLADGEEGRFYHNKVQAALFFCRRLLPLVPARLQAAWDGDLSPMDAYF